MNANITPPFWGEGVLEMDHKPRYGVKLPLGLAAYSGLVTAIYLYNRDPVFHQVSYALEVVVIVVRNAYLLSHIPAQEPGESGPCTRQVLRRLYMQGAAAFLLGFILWNVDNIMCTQLRTMRAQLAPPFDILLQFHGWWHILTGLGCYYCILTTQYMRIVFLNKLHQFELAYMLGIIPYVRPRLFVKKLQ
ncbi:alkaline ceramidase ydc1 [Dispira simplex]|nr:alkaline ceramidase ydc1 [Dispira simplex]